MLNVKNNQTGKVQELSDDSELPNLVESGKVSLPNKEFEFLSPEGEKYTVPAKAFLKLLSRVGNIETTQLSAKKKCRKSMGKLPQKHCYMVVLEA